MSLTTNKGIDIIAIGSPNWGTPINDNSTLIDKALGSFTTVSGTSGSITLTTAQYQNMCLKSGTAEFTGNVTFVIPSGVAGQWVVINQSATSNFELRIKNAANATFIRIPIDQVRTVYSDGTTVFLTDTQSIADFQTLQIGGDFITTGASCSGVNATVTFSGSYIIDVGQVISIRGVVPAGYNGIWTVTASSAGSVTFVVPAALGAQTNAGVLYYGAINASTINLTGRGSLSGRANQDEAQAATDNQTIMTPLRTAEAVGVPNSAMVKSAINATGAAPIYAARAWVNFNGASGAIRSSGNISSVTRNSLGQYTITILDNMPDANYAVSGTSSGADAANDEMILYVAAGTMAAGSVRVRTSSGSGNANDESIVSVIIHR
jgi:hypothetical protein